MSSHELLLFQPAKHLTHFSAVGYLTGTFQPIQTEEVRNFIPGTISTPDGRELKASIRRRDWEKIVKRTDIDEKSDSYWLLFFATTKWGNLSKITLITPIINPPLVIDSSGETNEEKIDLFQVRGRIQKIFDKGFSVRLEQKKKPPGGTEDGESLPPFYITIQGNLPPFATPEQFWEILCTRDGEHLHLKKATLITDEMVLEAEKNRSQPQAKKSSKSTQNKITQEKIKVFDNQEAPTNKTQLTSKISTENNLIMLNGTLPEMTVKFTEKPDLPTEGKKVTLQITGENGIVVKAEVNRKTLAKQVQKMESFESWIAALSGKVTEIAPDGVVILEGGNVQVFERKHSTKPEENEAQKAESVA